MLIRQSRTCRDCGGRGSVVDQPCSACAGAGVIEPEHLSAEERSLWERLRALRRS